jgi:peptide/nickel transport system ATP-binding protein
MAAAPAPGRASRPALPAAASQAGVPGTRTPTMALSPPIAAGQPPQPAPDPAVPVLLLGQVRVRYPGASQATLDGLDLRLHPGERLALVGPSGCGKSTVARTALQLLPPGSHCSGELRLAGRDPRQLSRAALRRLRGEAVGLVFQDPMTRLNPLLTIGEHLRDTLAAHHDGPVPAGAGGEARGGISSAGTGTARQRRQRVEELLQRVGIDPGRYSSYPHEFSGGMRQRLAIALALALRPPLVIADEPTTSLDVAVANQVMAELAGLCAEAGSALLLISHDLAMAGRWCERIAVLERGRLVEEAPSHTLLTAPASPLAQRLVAAARRREGGVAAAPPPGPPLLEIQELRSWHPLPSAPWSPRWLRAVDGVSLTLHEGETLGVVGASGCGKSSLCRALMGLAPVRGGTVRLQGEDLRGLQGVELRRARRSIQMVFQDPLACLNPQMAVGEAVADPLLIHGLVSRSEARERARAQLAAVGLEPPEDFERRLPRQLSGGQQQRVAIARALILEPKLLLCDESVSMLDAEVQAEVLELLRDLQGRLGLGMLFITHDLSVASGFCHRVIVLEGGRIVEEGPGEALLRQPRAAITRTLVEACPRLPAVA